MTGGNFLNILADTHSHTLVSGHAYSTIREMVRAAADKGLDLLAITEHAPAMPGTCVKSYFENLAIVPREMEGIEVLFGAELNILDSSGSLDLFPELCQGLDLTVASIHKPCFYSKVSEETVTSAYLNAMEKPYVNIIGHPDDARFPVNAEALVKKAKETHTLLEVNNASFMPNGFRVNAYETMKGILMLCKEYEVPVTTSNDAHIDVAVGDFQYVRKILNDCDFPEKLVVTTDLKKLKPYLNRFKEFEK